MKLLLFAVLVAFPLYVLAQATGTVPPVAPLPGVPVTIQSIWLYYVVPFVPLIIIVLNLITHFWPEGSKPYEVAKTLLNGAKRVLPQDGNATPAPMPKGFARPWTLVALACACILGCAALSKTTVSGTVSGQKADVTVTAPDGSAYGLLVENHQACLTMTQFLQVPGSNLECQPSCGALVHAGAVVTVNCRIVGRTEVFPFQFAVPLPGAKS